MTHMPRKLNESGGGFPGLIQYTWLINLIPHFEMAVYGARLWPNRFTLQCTVGTWVVPRSKKALGLNLVWWLSGCGLFFFISVWEKKQLFN